MATVDDRLLARYWVRAVRIAGQATGLVLLILAPLVIIPGDHDVPLVPFLILCSITAVGAALAYFLPWERLFATSAGLRLLYVWSIVDIAVITVFIWLAGPDRPNYFFLYVFTTLFFAACYRRRTQVVLFLFTAASYLTVWTIGTHNEPVSRPLFRVAALGIIAFMASFIARELMQQMAEHRKARRDADRTASLVRTVASGARSMTVLGPNAVLGAVIEATGQLGFEMAAICSLDEPSDTYRVIHSKGLPESYTDGSHDAHRGVLGMIWEERQTVTLDDYSSLSDANEIFKDLGLKAVIGTQIPVHKRLAAVLVAGTRDDHRITHKEVEAFELLASQASRALEVATEYEDLQRAEEQLRSSQEELEREKAFHASLVQAQSDLGEGVCIADLTTQRFEFVNDALCEMYGYTREELLGMPSFLDLMVPEEQERLEPRIEARLGGTRTSDHDEVTVVKKDGSRMRVEVAHKPLDERRVVVLVRDVTERWEWIKSIERSMSLLRSTLESTTDGILVVNTAGRIVAYNESFAEMWRIPRNILESGDDDRALGVVLDQLQDPDAFLSKVRALYVSDAESFDVLEFKDGRLFERYSQPQRVARKGGEIIGRVWSFRDVTARHQAERAIREAHDALVRADADKRRLLNYLVRAKEDERRRVASDIHDDSVQIMTFVAIGLERLLKKIDEAGQRDEVIRLEEAARGAVARLRAMVFELRPLALDEEGLASALRLYLEEFNLETGISFTLCNRLDAEPATAYRTVLYRIAQEALTNVRKHAGASNVIVTVSRSSTEICLRIEDDGVGFSPRRAENGSIGHIGIPEMRERAGLAGGRFEIRSTPGRGTTVEVSIPEPSGAREAMEPQSGVV